MVPFVITILGHKVSVTLTSEFRYSPSFAAYTTVRPSAITGLLQLV